MCLKRTLLIAFLAIYQSYAAVLLWSNNKIEISPLKEFDDDALEELLQDLGYPTIVFYKSHPSLLPEFKQLLKGYYKAYSPNSDLTIENATEISGKEDLKLLNAEQDTSDISLSLLVISNGRSKREADPNSSSTNTTTEDSSPSYKAPKGPVFYKGKQVGKGSEETYGLLYSSKPLLLKTADFSNLYLGNTADDMIQVDTVKDSYTRLNVKIQVEDDDIKNLITLRFIFSWSPSNYWTLMSVKISDTNNMYSFDNLNITRKVTAPAHFSYHCSGETVFSDSNNSAELYVYDLQTQIDSSNGKFSDAYDCVNFITAPILSGLFVSAILGIGLIVALIAISDIKTMDKFDNYKTKQLVVTVSE